MTPAPSDASVIAASLTDPDRFAEVFDRRFATFPCSVSPNGGWAATRRQRFRFAGIRDAWKATQHIR